MGRGWSDHERRKEDGENGWDSRGRTGRQKAWPAAVPDPEKAWSFHMTRGLQLWSQLSHCRPTAVFVLSPFDDSVSSENKAPSLCNKSPEPEIAALRMQMQGLIRSSDSLFLSFVKLRGFLQDHRTGE